MKYIIRIVTCLLLALSLTACAKGQAPDFVKGIKGLPYELANQETIITKQDGYSCTTLAQTWVGMRGENVYTLHPASKDVAIPPQKTGDCVIPFALTITCDTSDASFTTDISVAYSSIWKEGGFWSSGRFIVATTSRIDEAKRMFLMDWEYVKDRSSLDPTGIWMHNNYGIWIPGYYNNYSEVDKNEVHSIYGYYIIPDYFSPSFPEGNDDMLPTDEDFGVAVTVRVGPNASSEIVKYLTVYYDVAPEKGDVFLDFKSK